MRSILSMDSNLKPGTVAHQEHQRALGNNAPIFAQAMAAMLTGWAEYAEAVEREFGSKIGDDAVLGPHWRDIGESLRGLLDGHTGGFDGGSLWSNITECAKENNAPLPE